MKENKTNESNLVLEFIEYWQIFTEEWLKFAQKQTDNLKVFVGDKKGFINYGSIFKSVPNYFPEPYLGDPNNLTKNKIHAVFINLNPGGAGANQSFYEEGGYIKDLKANNCSYQKTLNFWNHEFYSAVKKNKDKKKLSAYGTLNWWDKYRAGWIDSFLKPSSVDYKIEIQHILGLELSPWHSKKFTEITDIDIQHVRVNVVDKAVTFSKQINNPFLRKDDCSIVLTCGAGFKNFFKKEKWEKVTPDFLRGKWEVWLWKYDEKTAILNFHQIKTKGAVKLNFPNDQNWSQSIQEFLLLQLKAMLA
jgi:hypothetical protein